VGIAKLPFSAVLLAGGESKRMGRDKAFLKLGGERLIDIVFQKLDHLFSEVIIVADRQDFNYLPAKKITGDLFKKSEKCALRGVHTGLSLTTSSACFIAGCDMPFLSLSLIRYMSRFIKDYDIVAPHLEGHYQPLYAFYRKSILEFVTQRLESNKLQLQGIYPHLKVKAIGEAAVKRYDPQLSSFHNVNTKENYLRAQKFYNLMESCS